MTMTNAEWIISTGNHFKQLRLIQHNELANRTYTIALCDKPIAELKDKGEPLDVFRKWLDMEHKEPILDEAERKYLAAVIKPFRDEVVYIGKFDTLHGDGLYEELFGKVKNERLGEYFPIKLPPFEKGTMYKGMQVGRGYTLEELGL